jgi:hypothetical protein
MEVLRVAWMAGEGELAARLPHADVGPDQRQLIGVLRLRRPEG